MLAAPVGVTFGVDDDGNITTTYDDALGDIADRRVVNLAESGKHPWLQTLAAASSGATFSITIGSGTTTLTQQD